MNNVSTAATSTTHLQNRNTQRKAPNTSQSFGQLNASPLSNNAGGSSSSLMLAILQLILMLISQLRERLEGGADPQKEGGSNPEQNLGEQQNQDQQTPTVEQPVNAHAEPKTDNESPQVHEPINNPEEIINEPKEPVDEPVSTQPPVGAVVPLTVAQESVLKTVTGFSGDVIDADSSGTLTEGDYISQGGTQHVLTAKEVNSILSFQPPYLDQLNPAQINAIEARTGLSNIRVDDNDLSGTLSAGDTVVSSDANTTSFTLTAEDIQVINENSVRGGNQLTLTDAQKNIIINEFGGTHGYVLTDTNADNKVSKGDDLLVRSQLGDGARGKLSTDQARHINGEFGNKLPVSDAIRDRINTVLNIQGNNRTFHSVLDVDGDKKIGAGDLVAINILGTPRGPIGRTGDSGQPYLPIGSQGNLDHQVGLSKAPSRNVPSIYSSRPSIYHRLTADEAAAINTSTSLSELELTSSTAYRP